MTLYRARILSIDRRASIAWLRCGRARIAARLFEGARRGATATVRIRPEDVMLSSDRPGRVSARNVLPARVRAIRSVPDGVRLLLDAGLPLAATLTQGAVRDLGLTEGTRCWAMVKASAVAPCAEARRRVTVGVARGRGTVPPETVSLLRSIRDRGSLSAAAAAEGVTFRTAWMRVKRADRAWGKPLVRRRAGGRGGGGSRLTPEGERVVSLSERAG